MAEIFKQEWTYLNCCKKRVCKEFGLFSLYRLFFLFKSGGKHICKQEGYGR